MKRVVMKYAISYLFMVILLLGMHPAMAQKQQYSSSLKGLSITFKVIANNYENKPQSRASMLFTVADNWKLPAQGWKIYFNFAMQVIPASVTADVNIRHINGDYFCIEPAAGFKGIGGGSSLEIDFTSSDWLISKTDQPDGFYLVWDAVPNQTYAITNLRMLPFTQPGQYMRSPLDKIDTVTAASIFAQNAAIRDIAEDSLVKIFPTPVSYHEAPGYFRLDAHVKVQCDAKFNTELSYLNQTINALLTPAKTNQKPSGKTIALAYKPMADEAYGLTITSNRVTISASTGTGIFYGIQSLKALMPPSVYQHKQQSILIKNVIIQDAPRFAYRAVMLDVARNFQSKHEILKLLDVMSLYKLNVLHFHLTDDEGWRLQIPGLPELTSVGAKRGHSFTRGNMLQPGLGSGPDVRNPSGSGYYSVADFVGILKYATQRHILIVPEIESPGHARAAIKAMDARYNRFMKLGQQGEAEKYLLHDLNDTSRYVSVQYYNDNVVDVSMPSTYRFITVVTGALVKMYRTAGAPLQTIHFGGDEVPAGAWLGSPAFHQLMKRDTGIRSVDALWPYYYKRVDSLLASRKLYLTAWEETGLVKNIVNNQKINVLNNTLVNHNVHLEVWNNVLGWGAEDLAYKQANAGYKVILSCVSNLYFDMASEKAFYEPGYYWGGYVDVDKLFKFIPYNYFKNTTEDRMGNPLNQTYLQAKEQLTPTGKANIVGLQGALWGETLKSPQRLEYMLLPKLLGLAERAWAANPEWATATDSVRALQLYNQSWSRFVNVLGKRELPRLDHYAGGFNYRIPEPGVIVQNGRIWCNTQFPGFTVRYTTNGTMPNIYSGIYTQPIPNPAKHLIKLALFNSAGRAGRIIQVGGN
jgi:hexosaminidase